MLKLRKTKSGVASIGMLSLVGSLAILAPTISQAVDSTYRGVNSSATCRPVGTDGKIHAPGPGDCAQFGKAGQGRSNAKARNVILIIGDGMGQQEITAARNYLKGAAGRFEGIDGLTSEGLYTHHSIDRDGAFNYVTDSAASATAWSTGTKTYNGALGVKIDGTPVPNLIEKAKLAGFRTGNITTSELQDATPAGVGAHAVGRKCYGPEIEKNKKCSDDLSKKQYRENGGLGSISEQLVEIRADVTMGGGSKAFDEKVQEGGAGRNPYLNTDEAKAKGIKQTSWEKGKTVLDNAKANGFQIVHNAAELDKLTEADQDKPVLGLFNPGNMTTRFAPHQATPGGSKKEPKVCEKQDTKNEPELRAMAQKTIDMLDRKRPNTDKGFFLQIESASIDKRTHYADACGQIGETERLDEVTKTALDYAKAHADDTLVIVTADHSHSTQILSDNTDSLSATARVLTHDGTPMTLGYGTADYKEMIEQGEATHTGAQLRVAAYGPGAQNVLGQTDQTDLHYTILSALGINPDQNKGGSDNALKAPVAASNPLATCYKVDQNGKVVAPNPGECAQYGTKGEQRSTEKAKNVILFIGDGMGDSEITSARDYLYGANGRLPGVDALPYTGSYTHYSLLQKTGLPDYVTDSAASGSGWATGTKTYNGAISVDLNGKPVANLIELAKAKGLKTGNVTTAELEDATPAVLGSHALGRKCYGPENTIEANKDCFGEKYNAQYRENGGLGSIAEQLVDTRADVTMGGGAKAFNQKVQVSGTAGSTTWEKGKTVLDNAKANGFQVATKKSELAAVKSADQTKPVLGLFASGNMERNFLRLPASTDPGADPKRCEKNPKRTAEMPTVAEMTSSALDLLQNDKGFFLQVEGASIDKADHDSDICGQIGELDDLDQAVQVARKWVEKSGEPTLIIVTADHAHTSQIVPKMQKGMGVTTTLLTADGNPMTVNYATAPTKEAAINNAGSTHTGTQLRIAAEGPSSQNVIGFTDQTDLHFTIANSLGLDAGPKTAVQAGFKFTPKTDGVKPGSQKPQNTDNQPNTNNVTPVPVPTTEKKQEATGPDKLSNTGSPLDWALIPAAILVMLAGGVALLIRTRRN